MFIALDYTTYVHGYLVTLRNTNVLVFFVFCRMFLQKSVEEAVKDDRLVKGLLDAAQMLNE